MKKICLLAVLWAAALPWAIAQDIKIKGSDTMLPLVESMIEMFNGESGQQISAEGGGSSTGFTALKSKSIDMAMASRPIRDKERDEFKSQGRTVKETILAYDALSIVTHPSNPVKKLTKEQLKKIFTGEIKNWSELGGNNLPIKLIIRDTKSGTYAFMKSHVMDGKDYDPNAIMEESNSGIIQAVSQNQGSIGYVGLAYVEYIVSTVAVSFDGKTYYQPTFKTAMEKKYPILRALYLYYDSAMEAKVAVFKNFALSSTGQKVATHKGYIPAVF